MRLGNYANYNLYNLYTWALRCSLSYIVNSGIYIISKSEILMLKIRYGIEKSGLQISKSG